MAGDDPAGGLDALRAEINKDFDRIKAIITKEPPPASLKAKASAKV